MSMIINDEILEARLLEERRAKGLDGFDEVWDGVYVMSPLANNEHQRVVTELTVALHRFVSVTGVGEVYQGANVSDQENWTENYRVPDILVFLKGTIAEDRGTHWFGGPEFAIEVVSKGDRTLEKLEFYGSVGTRELLVVDREPWQLTLYRKLVGAKELKAVAKTACDNDTVITADTLQLGFSLRLSDGFIRVARSMSDYVDVLIR